jgi:serine protease Do
LAVVLSMLGGGPYLVRQLAFAQQEAQVDKGREALRNSQLRELSAAFRQVAHVAEPSVVHISVSQKVAGHANAGRLSPDDLLRRFFRGQLPDDEDQQPQPRGKRGGKQAPKQQDKNNDDETGGESYNDYNVPEQYGAGSGWVYADGKHIITNNHVVEGADEIMVKFYDKTTMKATVVGTDPQTDIAVLKLPETKPLHAAKLAKEAVEQGDMVFAFGSPFQFEFSMSQGIVSGTGRELGILRNVRGYENFIQTDAAINPGNSGGPLMNIYGEVIGMNTAIATRTGANNGLGFAVPVDMIRNVADQLIAKGRVSRGYLGVYIKDVDAKMAKSFGYSGGAGVLVEDMVDANAPGAKAGMKPGDIITELNDKPITSSSELRQTVANTAPGKTIKVKLFRDGKPVTLEVKVEELPTKVAAGGKKGAAGADEGDEKNVPDTKLEPLRKLGIAEVSTFTEDAAKTMGVDFAPGVLIEDVRAGSVAFAEGLRPGVVITEVAGKPVKTVSDLANAMAKRDLKEGVRLRVRVDNMNRFVFLALP